MRRQGLTHVTIRTGDRIDLSSHRRGHEYSLRGLDKFQWPAIWGWHAWQEWDGENAREPVKDGVRYPAPLQAGMAAADVDGSATFNPDARFDPQY